MVEFQCANCRIHVTDIVGEKVPADELCMECRILSGLPGSDELVKEVAEMFGKPVPVWRLGQYLGQYVLIGQTPVPCNDLYEWAQWMETADRVVFQTVVGEYEVSTVFLGLDHNYARFLGSEDGEPLLFETMIFSVRARAVRAEKGHKSLEECLEDVELEEEGLSRELLDHLERWHTWSEAEAGHEVAVLWVEKMTGVRRNGTVAGIQRGEGASHDG